MHPSADPGTLLQQRDLCARVCAVGGEDTGEPVGDCEPCESAAEDGDPVEWRHPGRGRTIEGRAGRSPGGSDGRSVDMRAGRGRRGT